MERNLFSLDTTSDARAVFLCCISDGVKYPFVKVSGIEQNYLLEQSFANNRVTEAHA